MNGRPRPHPAGQRGQALTELLALCLALLPLMAAVVVVARYQDLARAADLASRYAAFAASDRGDGSLPDLRSTSAQVRQLFFAPASTPFNRASLRAAGGPTRAFWVDRGGRPLLGDMARSVQVLPAGGSGSSPLDSGVGSAGFEPVASWMQLPGGGLYAVDLRLAIAPGWDAPGARDPGLIPALELQRGSGVLVGSWHADSASRTVQAVQASPLLFPLAELQVAGALLDPLVTVIDAPGLLQGPQLSNVESWNAILPADRSRGAP